MNSFYEQYMLWRGMIFACLFAGFFLLFQKIHWLENVVVLLRKTKDDMEAASRQRLLENRKHLRDIARNDSVFSKLDQMLEYSGLKRKIPSLDVEKFLTFQVVGFSIIFLLSALLFDIQTGIIIVIILFLIETICLQYGKQKSLKSVNENLLKFLDFLGNYSVTSGEITSIFHQISKYMEEPLKGALEECCYEAETTGDVGMALLSMAEKVEHPQFKELIRNMEINLRYCADFTVLVASGRKSVRDYLRMKEERKSLLREGAIHLFLLLGMSMVVLLTVDGLVETSVWEVLFFTLPGWLSLGTVIVIILLFIGQMLAIEK